MSNEAANWRTGITSGDYFGQQKKTLAVADRRPVIRRASDLGLGPGILANAVPISDLNDPLATFDGYYSADYTTLHAPSSAPGDRFVGHIVSDAAYGGEQVFTRLNDGSVFRRVFTRAPFAPETITWEADWRLAYSVPVVDPLEGVWQNVLPAGAGDGRFQNGWVNYGSLYAVAAYMRKDGIVHLKGLIRFGSTTSNTPMFTLPEGFRPDEFRIFPALTDLISTNVASSHSHTAYNLAGRVDIAPAGGVLFQNGSNGFISLDGISFPQEG